MTSGNVKPVIKNNGTTLDCDVVISGSTSAKTLTVLAVNAGEISTQKISTFGGQISEFGEIETTSISNADYIQTDGLTTETLNAGGSVLGNTKLKTLTNRAPPSLITVTPETGVTSTTFVGGELGGQLTVNTSGSAPSGGAPIVTFSINALSGLQRPTTSAVCLISPMNGQAGTLADNKKPWIQWVSPLIFRLISNSSSLASNTTYVWGISILG